MKSYDTDSDVLRQISSDIKIAQVIEVAMPKLRKPRCIQAIVYYIQAFL